MEHLGKLFGTPAKVRLLRLFLFNPERVFDRDMLVHTARVNAETVKKECAALERATLIVRKSFLKEVDATSSDSKRRRVIGWTVDHKFPYVAQLTSFLQQTLIVSHADLRKRFRNVGAVQLLLVAHLFVGDRERALDLLIVGDRLDVAQARSVVRTIEAEYGRELRYTILTTDEYDYRRRVRDRLVREMLEVPHEEVINRLRER